MDCRLPSVLKEALARVRSVGVITGAGISAESGIPTYRGKGGIYDDPEEGDRTIEALSAPTLHADPDRTWRALAKIARAAGGAEPNPGHLAVVEMERHAERFVLLTQNVDGLHQRAGSANVIDIHGNTFETICTSCGLSGRIEDPRTIDAAPRCPECGGVLRPDVVLFGEMLPLEKVQRIREEFYYDPPDLVLCVGTSAMFPYIVEPVSVAAQAGRLTIEVNPEPQLGEIVTHTLTEKAGTALPAIAAELRRASDSLEPELSDEA